MSVTQQVEVDGCGCEKTRRLRENLDFLKVTTLLLLLKKLNEVDTKYFWQKLSGILFEDRAFLKKLGF